MASEVEFLDAYQLIKEADEEICLHLGTAIEHEEREEIIKAIAAYEVAGQKIEQIFKIPVGLPHESSAIEGEWLDACGIIKKLKAAKETIGQRLKVLREQNNFLLVDQDAQEAIEEEEQLSIATMTESNDEPATKKRSVLVDNPSVGSDMKTAIETYKKYSTALRQVMAIDHISEVQFDQIFQSSVKLYKITGNGAVETMTGEGTMSLIMCTVREASEWHFLNGATFMQCSLPETPTTSNATCDAYKFSFIYPLLPAITTVYRTEYGAFIFPDMEATFVNANNAYGIIISNEMTKMDEEAFADLEQFFLDMLEAILAGEVLKLTTPTEATTDEHERTTRDVSEKISQGIVSGADFIARVIVRGAEKTGELIDRGTPQVMSKLQGAPENARPVSTSVQRSIGVAKAVTGVAAQATGWVAGKIGAAAVTVGTYLSPHVQSQGSKLLERGFGYDSAEAESRMKGAMTVAAGAFEGITTIYGGLEQSADVLGKSLSTNSVKIISHKYGTSAGGVAADTFETFGNTWHVSRNLKIIRPKNLAEKVLKNTGAGVVTEFKTSTNKNKIIQAGDIQPDLFNVKKFKNT